MRNRIARRLTDIWYSSEAPPGLLRAASALYARVVRGRLVRPSATPPCPVIVVGNLVAGGSGKTPVVAALADSLAEAGYAVSIISRGYGGREGARPVRVEPGSSAVEVGDEALELHSRTGRPVWVCRKRDSALAAALADGAQVVLSDDGLQHRALPRSFEICVVDARRGLGNGFVLPAGPLRQPADRLETVDMVLVKCGRHGTGTGEDIAGTPFELASGALEPVRGDVRPPQPPAHIDALAGIADPESFFDTLERRGFRLRRHPLVDHQPITAEMLAELSGPVVMTAKDSMRLPRMADEQRDDLFVLPACARLPEDVLQRVVDHVREFPA
ncbi:MAG TPA: tetraacyldisaccharide 4'-kinase [Wenzhouxiangellaceae bacterium]|nr:tetraacyldisaccharide 4'-kinase [Wenzhouxiangellaceae bacterium]